MRPIANALIAKIQATAVGQSSLYSDQLVLSLSHSGFFRFSVTAAFIYNLALFRNTTQKGADYNLETEPNTVLLGRCAVVG